MKVLTHILCLTALVVTSLTAQAQTIDTVCTFNSRQVYRVVPTPGSTYYWNVQCGTIVSDNVHADSVVVEWCQTPGIYQLSVVEKNKAGCWGDTVKAWIMVSGKMHLAINGPTEICDGDPVVLQASGAVNYKWNTGETQSAMVAKPHDSTTYSVVGYGPCNTDTAYFRVKVDPKPKAGFTYKPTNPIVNDTVFFHYTGTGANQWTWYFGDKNTLQGQITDPQVTFNEKGDKVVTLVATNAAGCSDTISYTVHVKYDSKIFVPDVFTPDGDGVNDVFKAVGYNLQSIHMQIYNRWGEKLFESTGLDDAWDGTFKGARVMEGVYIYMIQATATDGETYYLHGNVTVMY